MLPLIIAAALAQTQVAPHPALTDSSTILQLDLGKLKGEPWRLSWSPDSTELYLETVERDRSGAVKSAHHYLISTAAKAVKNLGDEPAWADKYWGWKSGRSSPADPAFRIDVEQRQETVRAIAAPMGGELARGGTVDAGAGTTVADVNSAANQSQIQTVFELRVKGESIGKWVNEPVVPGLNWSWAPAPARLILIGRRDGSGLVFVDQQGHKTEATDTRGALLPAVAEDGTRVAWLVRRDKKRVDVAVASLAER